MVSQLSAVVDLHAKTSLPKAKVSCSLGLGWVSEYLFRLAPNLKPRN